MSGDSGRLGGRLGGAARLRAAYNNAVVLRVVDAPSAGRSAGSAGSAASTMRPTASAETIAPADAHDAIQQAFADQRKARELETTLSILQARCDALEAAEAARSKRGREALALAPAGHTRARAADASAVAEPAPERTASALRAVGCGKASQEALSSVARGQVIMVQPRAKYRSGYDFDDVCDLGQRLGAGTLTLAEMRRNPSVYKVPRKTMEGYLKPRASDGVPRWRIMREEQRCTTLPKTGGRTVLGDAVEKKLMLTISDAALMHCPYRYTEVEEMIRRTCVEMKCVVGSWPRWACRTRCRRTCRR